MNSHGFFSSLDLIGKIIQSELTKYRMAVKDIIWC